MIFACSAVIGGVALYALIYMLLVEGLEGSIAYYDGVGPLVLGLMPASAVAAVGISFFLLTRWAIWFAAFNLLVALSAFGAVSNISALCQTAIALGVLSYGILLRRHGILT